MLRDYFISKWPQCTFLRLSQSVPVWKNGSYANGAGKRRKWGGGRETLVMWLCLCLQNCGCVNTPPVVFSQGLCAVCWQDRDYLKPHSTFTEKIRGRGCNAHSHPLTKTSTSTFDVFLVNEVYIGIRWSTAVTFIDWSASSKDDTKNFTQYFKIL